MVCRIILTFYQSLQKLAGFLTLIESWRASLVFHYLARVRELLVCIIGHSCSEYLLMLIVGSRSLTYSIPTFSVYYHSFCKDYFDSFYSFTSTHFCGLLIFVFEGISRSVRSVLLELSYFLLILNHLVHFISLCLCCQTIILHCLYCA